MVPNHEYVPELVYVNPFQVYVLQDDTVVIDVVGTHKHVIVKGNDCVSISPSSELITLVKVKVLAPGFEKILLNITICKFPLVTLLLSGTDCAKILMPPVTFEIVNVPNDNPVAVFMD